MGDNHVFWLLGGVSEEEVRELTVRDALLKTSLLVICI